MIVAEVNNISLHVPVYSYNAFSIKKKNTSFIKQRQIIACFGKQINLK